jgi:hypothetical protein
MFKHPCLQTASCFGAAAPAAMTNNALPCRTRCHCCCCCCREKNSAKVDRLVQFTGNSQIVSLPPYLTVQMMRFFFKRTPDGGQKAKILRKVCSCLCFCLCFCFCLCVLFVLSA